MVRNRSDMAARHVNVQYQDAAAAFLQTFPLGVKVRGEEIITWAEDHADGLASDLLIGDDKKKLTALRRHLNSGGASRCFAEDELFYIDVVNAKRNVFAVRKLADRIHDKATAASGRAARQRRTRSASHRSASPRSKPRAKTRARKTPKRRRKIDIPPLAMSVDQFCQLHNIGRDLFYELLKEDKGPDCMLLKKRRLISFEASERWRREREQETMEKRERELVQQSK